MIQKWLKGLVLSLKLLFITKKQEIIPENKNLTTSNAPDLLEVGKVVDFLNGGVHKEDKYFKRENNLVQEFVGEAPIVYESDMKTIKKQSQYGYIGEDAINEPDELLANDIDLMKDIDKTVITSKNADFMTSKENFEARWEEIKKRARQDEPDSDLDQETDYIDGIIKE